jgi:hypothetical protein
MKKIVAFFLILGTGYALFSMAIWHLTDGFSIANIRSDLVFSPQWEVVNPPLEETLPLLAQDFYYLGRGSQCYVFESEDKQLVLKFFRHSRYRLPKITGYIACPTFLGEIQNQKREAKQRKLDALFQSCKIAYEELQDETGLLYLHLNKSAHLNKTVILYDKLKRAHPIHIDDYEFIIQKHGEQIYPYLFRLLAQGKKSEAKEALEDLALLLCSRLNKGIADHDAVIHKNAGFRANKALFLDVGEFSKERCNNPGYEVWQATGQLRRWLQEKDPELADYFGNIVQSLASG